VEAVHIVFSYIGLAVQFATVEFSKYVEPRLVSLYLPSKITTRLNSRAKERDRKDGTPGHQRRGAVLRPHDNFERRVPFSYHHQHIIPSTAPSHRERFQQAGNCRLTHQMPLEQWGQIKSQSRRPNGREGSGD
jgi:hypothetical protein